MYQVLLTRRYLTRKVTPLLAILAVAMCTAMVLIVWSVMAGFLSTLLATGRTMMGDVEIAWPVVGFARYGELIERLEADPMVAAATPVVDAPGLLGLPSGNVRVVRVMGVDGEGFDRVTSFGDLIWWKPLQKAVPADSELRDQRLTISPEYEAEGRSLTEPDPVTGRERPAVMPGVMLSGRNERRAGGWLRPTRFFLPDEEVTLSVLPVSRRGAVVSVEARRFPVANEFKTNFHEFDANVVLIRLDALQEMLRMGDAARFDPSFDFATTTESAGRESFADPVILGTDPARATSVFVRAADGVTPETLRSRTREIYAQFAADFQDAPGAPPDSASIHIQTWEERPGIRDFIAAVKKEIGLVLVLFIFISMTAVFLVCAIFWAMVSEKTRDIGILRSLGAGKLGVAWIYVRYGLVIGVIGSLVGGAIAYAIVWNINPIHEWLGSALGIVVWDPAIYYFTRIPNEVEPLKAAIVLTGGVLFSALGALLPAARAASLDPVKALRFE